jgi:hypothetical protein
MTATARQTDYIVSLVRRNGFEASRSVLQTAYDEAVGDGWKISQSGWAKHLLRKLDRDQASALITNLQEL